MLDKVQAVGGVTVNDRFYRMPTAPTIVICIDGSEPGYIEAAIAAGLAPTLARFVKEGTSLLADSVIPSFTNPNNLSIITGRPPAVHGIAGNYYYDPETNREVMMNDPELLRAPTILSALHEAGAKVAVITAKDKLRLLLSKGLNYATGRAIAFSSERAQLATRDTNGIDQVLDLVGMPLPNVYSPQLSEFVFAAAVKLLEGFRPDVMYLSTTDFVQHKAGPGTRLANDFYAMIDRYLAAFDRSGATIVITADHGMNAKHRSDGTPDVLYLQQMIDSFNGFGRCRVILPITDPYVAHHGALGSFATIYVSKTSELSGLMDKLRTIDGIELVMDRSEGCARFELPEDRVGDILVLANQTKVFGTSPAEHDLSGLDEPLRSHGGLSEQRVPMIANGCVSIESGQRLRNFDAFAIALNHVQASGASR
jgi:phosphonoacetate hydrolase